MGILNGSVPFLADLTRSADLELEVDFLGLTRFGEGGRVDIAYDCATDLTDRHVVLVEDIVDTGLTLSSLRSMIEIRRPASLSTVTLIDKSARRLVDVPLEYRGFEVGDEFLLGYGMDWENAYRNLPGLWAVMDFATFVSDPGCLAQASLEGETVITLPYERSSTSRPCRGKNSAALQPADRAVARASGDPLLAHLDWCCRSNRYCVCARRG